MDSVDHSVLQALRSWQTECMDCWLVTVVQTFGSSPRLPGAMLALRRDGMLVGSVSGGCIEDDLAARARDGRLPTGHAEVLTYGVTAEEAMRFGLPCGGTLRIVVEPVRDFSWVSTLLERIGRHELVARSLTLGTLDVTLTEASRSSAMAFDAATLTTVHGPRWRLLIIGAGQTSAYLARMAQALDYEVIICDPRIEYRESWDVPDARVMTEMPDDAVLALAVDSRTAIIALTHDPRLDDMALLEALKSPAFYVGALGSARNNARRRERLALFDLSMDEIARLHGPVGLDIGSRTPAEIAIAILAHLIAIRHRQFPADQPALIHQETAS
ncbi:putative xanthine dehydrogenase subunit A [mine drainage metagenome]|uniref:Putative xanthine dehydrogenase subunit A n=1 Tax=mine drainage metagenome TaxID=410659 RepID=A0A1J5Q3H6_9ZZZZ